MKMNKEGNLQKEGGETSEWGTKQGHHGKGV